MKYIIMCGGHYNYWEMPRQLVEINGEPIVARTIRLLKECGIKNISISSDNPIFEQFNLPVLKHDNYWNVYGYNKSNGSWANGFYPTNYPVCYIFGDVVFSKAAIQKIVETETNDIEFFASAPPFSKDYVKPYAEPFAFKVVNVARFHYCIDVFNHLKQTGVFFREPIAWELWQIIQNTPLNVIDYTNYTVINDYTCDIDVPDDIKKFKNIGD